MLKNTQFKIIFIFFIVGIAIISGLGVFFLNSLADLQAQFTIEQIVQVQTQTKIALLLATVIFAMLGIAIAIFLSKFVIYPINKLIQSAEKVTEEDGKNKKIFKNKRFKIRRTTY